MQWSGGPAKRGSMATVVWRSPYPRGCDGSYSRRIGRGSLARRRGRGQLLAARNLRQPGCRTGPAGLVDRRHPLLHLGQRRSRQGVLPRWQCPARPRQRCHVAAPDPELHAQAPGARRAGGLQSDGLLRQQQHVGRRDADRTGRQSDLGPRKRFPDLVRRPLSAGVAEVELGRQQRHGLRHRRHSRR